MTPDGTYKANKKSIGKSRRDRYIDKNFEQWDNFKNSAGINTARSHKIYPESIANTARDDFSNINEMQTFIDAENGPDATAADNNINKEFTLNNGELSHQLNKNKRSHSKKKNLFI
jgi:hypothetical protein